MLLGGADSGTQFLMQTPKYYCSYFCEISKPCYSQLGSSQAMEPREYYQADPSFLVSWTLYEGS